jgi:hypothetical protein
LPSAEPGPGIPGPRMHDEPGSRTRLAWLRTCLAALAVGALMLRGLILAGAGWVALSSVVACVLAFIALAMARSVRLGPLHSPSPSPVLLVAAAMVIVVLAALGLVYVVLPAA